MFVELESDQFRDRLAVVEKVARPAIRVDHLSLFRINATMAVDSSEDLVDMYRALGGFTSHTVGGTDDLSHVQAAANNESTLHGWPVVAPAVLVYLGRAPKFTPNNDRDVIEHGSIAQVLDEIGYTFVQIGKTAVSQGNEIL